MTIKTIYKDARSFKVVILADYFVNPHRYPNLPNQQFVYEKLRDLGYGLIKMPPLVIDQRSLEGWLRITSDQIEEYTERGFQLSMLGVDALPQGGIWHQAIKDELQFRNVRMPSMVILSIEQLSATPNKIEEVLSPLVEN
jgi:hypothetical protein